MSDAPPSHLPGQEPCQPVSRSSSVGSSTSTALSVPSLVRSQSLPVQLPPASTSQQHALSAQTLPSPFRENVVPSPMRLNAIMAPSQSPYVPPYNLAGHRIQQQLPPLTSAFARRMSLPPLLWFGEGQHQFLTPTPNLPPVQPSGPLSDAASQQPSSSSTSAGREMRRTKSHVVTACSNCKKAHLACDGMSHFLLFTYLFASLSYFCFYGLDFGIGSVCFHDCCFEYHYHTPSGLRALPALVDLSVAEPDLQSSKVHISRRTLWHVVSSSRLLVVDRRHH
ncbi:hypothetical protein V1505DRAFT_367231 [Lipomyces doorenjongii]